MVLSDQAIYEAMGRGTIVIEPYDKDCLGSNSYDVHLGKTLATYRENSLDAKRDNPVDYFDIPEEGILIQPGTLYLGSTVEYTETHGIVPFLEGKSSIGRLGINIHATAGKGDIGYCNHWTLEITCIIPVRIYAGMPIGQLIYKRVDSGEYHDLSPSKYTDKKSAKYVEKTDKPVPSKMWKNFPEEEWHNEHRHRKVYQNMILTSMPAKRRWVCRDCKETGMDTIGGSTLERRSELDKDYDALISEPN